VAVNSLARRAVGRKRKWSRFVRAAAVGAQGIGVIALAQLGCIGAAERTALRIVGSDVLGADFTQRLFAAGSQARLNLHVTLDGSLPAAGRLQQGTADAGLLILAPGSATFPVGFRRVPLAYFAVAVVAAAENPLDRITPGQLTAVFGPRETATAPRWGDLGLAEPWATRAISLHAPAPAGGLAHDLFRHLVLGGRPLRDTVVLHKEGGQAVAPAVAARPGAIGFLPATDALSAGLKILAVGVTESSPAFRPEARALHLGRYLLRLPLELVYRETASPELAAFLQLALGEQGAALFASSGLIPSPAEARAEALAGLRLTSEILPIAGKK